MCLTYNLTHDGDKSFPSRKILVTNQHEDCAAPSSPHRLHSIWQ